MSDEDGYLPAVIEAWHEIVASLDTARIPSLLAPDVVFRSPAVHTPQEGLEKTVGYLSAALVVLGPTVRYHRQWIDLGSAVLEFTATLDGLEVHGVDMIGWNHFDQITSFTVMVRPLKGLHKLVELMGAQLAAQSGWNPDSPGL